MTKLVDSGSSHCSLLGLDEIGGVQPPTAAHGLRAKACRSSKEFYN